MAASQKGKVYRVIGLTRALSDDELAHSLATAINEKLRHDEKPVLEQQIAIVPSCYDDPRCRVALVEFLEGVPAFLAKTVADPLEEFQMEMCGMDFNFDRHFLGFTQLYSPTASHVDADIIAISGLDGNAYGSWRGKGDLGRMWLRNFLSEDLPSCRTMIYGYNSKLLSGGIDTILDYGRGLIEEIKKIRMTPDAIQRPIYFIAHSFGGIVLAQCLIKAVQASEESHPTLAAIYKATYGILFFGVPHKGLIIEDLQQMIGFHSDDSREDLLQQIKSRSALLASQLDDFKNLIRDRKIVSFYETRRTRKLNRDENNLFWERSGDFVTMVESDSALLQLPDSIEEKIPLSADHSHIVKFNKKKDLGYESALHRLIQFQKDAPEVVAKRFQPEYSNHSQQLMKYFLVPNLSVAQFFGRASLLEDLQKHLMRQQPDDTPSRVVLQALGGQGKTQIAQQLCRKLKPHCRGVFWLNASSKDAIERSFEEVAEKLNQASMQQLEDISAKIKFVKDTVFGWNESWLAVYDNYDDPNLYDLRDYLLDGQRGKTLITSRHESTRRLGKLFQIPSMIDDGGVELLLRDQQIQVEDQVLAEATKIVAMMGGLALAIDQAAAYMTYKKITLTTFLEEYETKKSKILRYTPKELWEYRKIQDPLEKGQNLSAFTTWEMSFEQVSRGNESHKSNIIAFLSVIAFMDTSHISDHLFKAHVKKSDGPFKWLDMFTRSKQASSDGSDCDSDTGPDKDCTALSPASLPRLRIWSAERFWSIINHLSNLSLVQTCGTTPSPWFSIHPVIRDWLQIRQGTRASKESSTRQAMDLITYALLPIRPVYFLTFVTRSELLRHMYSCRKHEEGLKLTGVVGTASMAFQTIAFATFYAHEGKWDASRKLLERLFNDQSDYDLNDPSLQITMFLLAKVYDVLEEPNKAEKLLLQVLDWTRKTLGLEHSQTLETTLELARIYYVQNRFEESLKLQTQVLSTRERTLGRVHRSTIQSMSELADAHRNQGQLDQARNLDFQVLKCMESAMGGDNHHTPEDMVTLAEVYCKQGRWDKAEQLETDVVETYTKILGSTHLKTLDSKHRLARIYRSQNRIEEAENLHLQLLGEYRSISGEDIWISTQNKCDLAEIYISQSRWTESENLYLQILDCARTLYGENGLRTLSLKNSLARIYVKQDDLGKAEELGLQVVDTLKTSLGEADPYTLKEMDFLVFIYTKGQQLDKAEPLAIQVMNARRATLGEDHSGTLETTRVLASIYQLQRRYDEASKLQSELIDIKTKSLGENHLETLLAMVDLICTLEMKGELFKATDLTEEFLKRCHKVKSPQFGDAQAKFEKIKKDMAEWVQVAGQEGLRPDDGQQEGSQRRKKRRR